LETATRWVYREQIGQHGLRAAEGAFAVDFRKILQPIAGRAEARQAIKMSLRVKEMNKRQLKSKAEE
jgi:hypothetical protein